MPLARHVGSLIIFSSTQFANSLKNSAAPGRFEWAADAGDLDDARWAARNAACEARSDTGRARIACRSC